MMVKLCLSLLLTVAVFTAAVPFDDCPGPGTVSRLDQSRGEIEEAPTPAPSMAHLCTSQTSNARGHYTSTLAPCVFTFHTIQEKEDRLIDFETSRLCNDNNGFLIMKEYVYDWRDECVGDFRRCYSLEHHRNILFDFLCAMDWKIPEETTHVSVNCMEDKELVLEAESSTNRAQQHDQNGERLEQVELKMFNVALVLGSCLAGIYVISQWIVKPLVAQSSLQLDQDRDRPRCGCSSIETCQCGGAGSMYADYWTPSQRIRLEMDESEHHPDEHDDSSPHITNEAQAIADGFDMQVPADFDAVPIVQATILPEMD